jgi:histidine ammonia-lyase
MVERTEAEAFRRGALAGFGPEVSEEEVIRAMMVVRANAMTYNAPSPQLSRMLLDLLNRASPRWCARAARSARAILRSSAMSPARWWAPARPITAACACRPRRRSRSRAEPIKPFAADENALTSSDAYATGQAALAVYDARRALEWADLIYAMDLNGMNSSMTPLSSVVQLDRPERWLNWDAARVLDMIKGSYLFESDPKRIIQDPESLRASSIRQAPPGRNGPRCAMRSCSRRTPRTTIRRSASGSVPRIRGNSRRRR